MVNCSITTCIIILIVIVFSIAFANLALLITVDKEIQEKIIQNNKNLKKNAKFLHIADLSDHLMWFLQVSDLHISIFGDQRRIQELENFLEETVTIINPSVVLASGDITDGREANIIGSRQIKREWEIYNKLLIDSKIQNKTHWLDIRGNHDYFNVPHIDSELNYFRKYSIQGKKHKRSYMHQINAGGDKYTFIAVDACLEPGPKRPLNFFGLLSERDTNDFIEMNESARKTGSNYTIAFGHYPTSCILSPLKANFREIIGRYDEIYAYMCGHLHTQGGFIPHMYTLQKNGFLELELGDWKNNRIFRVASFDHGLFSFIDVRYNDWPIILVTNPKRALLNLPHKENINLQLGSEYIRILIFSKSKVNSCFVKIENRNEKECRQVTQNLFVVPWDPKEHSKGIVSMMITVVTQDGKIKNMEHKFSLDGSVEEFSVLGRLILMTDLASILQAVFGTTICFCCVPLCLLRVIHEVKRYGKLKKLRPRRIKPIWLQNTIKKFWILSSVDRIMWPLLLYCVYISLGPWSFGALIDNTFGIAFLWGIFIVGENGISFLPSTLGFGYATFQLTFCQLPLTYILANETYTRYNSAIENKSSKTKLIKYFRHLPFCIIIFIELILSLTVWYLYGLLSFTIAPFRTWSIILHSILWFMTVKLPEKCFSSAKEVWNS